MNLKAALLGFFLAASMSHTALAHPQHDEPMPPASTISEDAAKTRAREEVVRLAALKKVEDSWIQVPVKSVAKKTVDKRWEWLITFENAKAKEKTLYVFLKPSGEFIAANFTGK